MNSCHFTVTLYSKISFLLNKDAILNAGLSPEMKVNEINSYRVYTILQQNWSSASRLIQRSTWAETVKYTK